MNPKNKLTDICTSLTLEQAKKDITKECKLVKEQDKYPGDILSKNTLDQNINPLNSNESMTNKTKSDENSDDEEIRKWREKRLMQLKKRQELKKDGVYIDVIEKDFIPTVVKNACVVCHFYDNNFKRCHILHTHLIKLANIHLATKFIKVEAKNCLFFMNKLNIKVLPSLCLFIDGVLVKTCIGFEDFGNKDEFKTKDLELFLFKKNLIRNTEYNESDEED
ncbi:phosducin-like protein, putative [Plasmodium vinckei petteri]|uniref:Phosducin-like protein, putative n=1 Tax=Plasmodium vinckei petteri TaxID=138298 RepID=A0A6V7SJH1_PLAVN|nr:phosducin-like protein, putative [Plasmodium vinckei petteri]